MDVLRRLHAWSGLVLCLALVIIGASGALAAFAPEILQASYPSARHALPAQATFAATLDRFEASGASKIMVVSFNYMDTSMHRLFLQDGRQQFIDGVTGAPVTWEFKGPWMIEMHRFHHSLFAGSRGDMVIGLVGAAGLLMIGSGLALMALARRPFRLRVVPAGGRRADLLAAHADAGLMFTVLIVPAIVSGLLLLFRPAVEKALDAAPPAPPQITHTAVPQTGRWAGILSAAIAAVPHNQLVYVQAPVHPHEPYSVNFQTRGAPRGYFVTVWVDPTNDRVLRVDHASLAFAHQVLNSAAVSHGGESASLPGRILVFISGVGLAYVSLLGALAFLRGGLGADSRGSDEAVAYPARMVRFRALRGLGVDRRHRRDLGP